MQGLTRPFKRWLVAGKYPNLRYKTIHYAGLYFYIAVSDQFGYLCAV